ncbi:hypothetical protein [Streptomyces sp. S1D4-14]|uniref:putative phage holin n=1 Tax=Streptomyces sp. S1D4-14 TaxID=2594461 RepID=UPI001163C61A|nr:hypothetical protein [Streptomyces sp. S1D4-14]QDN64457.1 hypothetical protein FNV66_01085 [Streptomyces sp. S1D4-14]
MSNSFITLYLCFTGYLVTSGLTMIVAYSLSYPWWRSGLGRVVVLYASAEILMSVILCLAVVWHINPAWFRALWFGLQAVVGTTFCVQTAVIVRLRRGRRQREHA